jgi:hypothetical protein
MKLANSNTEALKILDHIIISPTHLDISLYNRPPLPRMPFLDKYNEEDLNTLINNAHSLADFVNSHRETEEVERYNSVIIKDACEKVSNEFFLKLPVKIIM